MRLCHHVCSITDRLFFTNTVCQGKSSPNHFISSAINTQHIGDTQFMETVVLHKIKSTHNTRLRLHKVLMSFYTVLLPKLFSPHNGELTAWNIYTPNFLCLWFFATYWENDLLISIIKMEYIVCVTLAWASKTQFFYQELLMSRAVFTTL